MMGMFIVVLPIMLLIVLALRLITGYDPAHGLSLNGRVWAMAMAAAVAMAALIGHRRYPMPRAWMYGVLAAYLVTASITDIQTQAVHDFLHLAGCVGGGILLVWNRPGWALLGEAAFFIAIQMLLFRRMYGIADCLAFSVCTLYMAASGKGMMAYVLHMGATFLLLAAVQAGRGNINWRGNLKEPVAMIPYIAGTVWIFI